MLARVAENVYWLGRYLERAENTVRLLDVHSRIILDLPDIEEHAGWMPIIKINSLEKTFARKHSQASESTVCQFLLADSDNSGSLLSFFNAIQYNLRTCRDILPRSTYREINSAYRFMHEHVHATTGTPRKRSEFMRAIQQRLLAISGELDSNMLHDITHGFMRLGCLIERADMTSRIIDVQSSIIIASENDDQNLALHEQRWVAVLRSLSAMQMYRQHIRRPINGEDTLRFLLLNNKLPRAYLYCVEHLEKTLRPLANTDKPLEATNRLRQQLESADYTELAQQPMQLHHYVDALQLSMQQVADAINNTYFPRPQDQ